MKAICNVVQLLCFLRRGRPQSLLRSGFIHSSAGFDAGKRPRSPSSSAQQSPHDSFSGFNAPTLKQPKKVLWRWSPAYFACLSCRKCYISKMFD